MKQHRAGNISDNDDDDDEIPELFRLYTSLIQTRICYILCR